MNLDLIHWVIVLKNKHLKEIIRISKIFKLEIFPSDIYFLEELPSEINLYSIFVIFILSVLVSAIASYIPARHISKMKTLRGLKYE